MKTPTERAAEAIAIEPDPIVPEPHLLPDGRIVTAEQARQLRTEACEALIALDDGADPDSTLYRQLLTHGDLSGFSPAGARTFARNRLMEYATMVVEVAPERRVKRPAKCPGIPARTTGGRPVCVISGGPINKAGQCPSAGDRAHG